MLDMEREILLLLATHLTFDKLKGAFYRDPVAANTGMNLEAAKTEVLSQFPS